MTLQKTSLFGILKAQGFTNRRFSERSYFADAHIRIIGVRHLAYC